jgi:Tfp pilus assembly protein PilF
MKLQIGTVVFSLVTSLAACGGDRSSPEDTRINYIPPQISGPVAGFGSGVAEKPTTIVEGKAAAELPKVETYIPAKASECIALGKEMIGKGDHKRARELLEAAIKLDKKSATPHVELARSYIATSERALAIRHAAKAVKLAPESSQAHNTLGRAELLRHQYDAAIVAFRQATELDANNVWAWNNLGLVHMTQKNYQEAVNALVEATGRKGGEGYMWNNLGLAYEQLDQVDDARDAFEHGAKLGSVAAKASRKRLEGVATVAIAKKVEKTDVRKDSGFEAREPMPEVVDEPEVIDSVEIEHGDGDVVPEVTEPVEEKKAPPTTL